MTAHDTAPTPVDAGKRPTSRQRTTLEVMAPGNAISYHTTLRVAWLGGGCVHLKTLAALKARGWIAESEPMGPYEHYRITDAGRRAIEDRADDAGE